MSQKLIEVKDLKKYYNTRRDQGARRRERGH